jgi:hypothetical protein
VAVVGVVSSAWPAPAPPPAPPAADAVGIPPAGAYASSAFCPGGAGTAAATTIYLTNSTAQVVTGVMTSVSPAPRGGRVPTVRRRVAVPALGSAALNPALGLPAGNVAASFVFDGGGVVAHQVVSGPGGWSTAPCASRTSAQWAFAGGSTVAGNRLTLALFNPAAPESVVNVSFLTSTGMVTPQAYQGLVVPPGQLVTADIGQFVQKASDIATFVTAQSGALVSTEFQQWSTGSARGSGLSLRLGSPSLSTTWQFAQTTSAPGAAVTFELANPSPQAVTATLAFGLAAGTVVPRRVAIPPLAVADFVASGPYGLPQQIPYSVSVTATAPIVVGRSVRAGPRSVSPQQGSSSGTVTLATHWLVPGPGVPHAPGTAQATVRSLAVADPGASAAMVTVTGVGSPRPSVRFSVPPGRLVVLGSRLVGGLAVYSVTSSVPVTVEEDSGPSGSPGVVSSTGFSGPGS